MGSIICGTQGKMKKMGPDVQKAGKSTMKSYSFPLQFLSSLVMVSFYLLFNVIPGKEKLEISITSRNFTICFYIVQHQFKCKFKNI